MNKKNILIVAALTVGSVNLVASDFSWNDYKEKNVEKRYKQNATPEKVRKAKEYVKSQYGVSASKKSIEELRREITEKSMEIGMEFSRMQDFRTEYSRVEDTVDKDGNATKTIVKGVSSVEPSSYGLYMKGKLDLQSIGFGVEGVYAKAGMYQDLIDIDITKRIIGDDSNGFAFDIGGGFHVSKKNTYIYTAPLHPYLTAETKYKTDNLTTTFGVKYDIGKPGNLFLNDSGDTNLEKYKQSQEPIYFFSLGYRF